ncbi:MAG: homocysteine S-methyltransferase family protein [Terrimicrobiaceae bacterium]|nr:homocysteine S-methyltransferase family protein [Terrimicrobiaceae bacterium]
MNPDLLSASRSAVLVCDGAMGTQLMLRGLTPGECGMRWNEERAADVGAVHSAYAQAGCRVITTNSFGGTRTMLGRHGLGDQVLDWNRKAAALARAAAGGNGWVFGDVGPFGDFLEPLGETAEDELLAIFSEQIGALVEGGADAILVETMSDPAEAAIGARAAKSVSGLPVAVTFAFQKSADGFRTMMGTSAREAIAAVLGAGAEIVGANCGTDLSLDDYVALAEELKAAAGTAPVILQPNAGAPKSTPQGVAYDATPDEMAAAALRLRGAGISIIGGCCGTTPAHLAAMARALA